MLNSDQQSAGHWQLARVVDVVRETATTVSVVFATPEPYAYRPGQFARVEFRIGRGRFRRAYSLSSVPSDDLPRFTIKQVPGGKVSHFVASGLAIGDAFRVSGAEGRFQLPDSRAGRRFVLVAGGVGIAPVMSLLRTLLAMPEAVPVALIYYSRNGDDIIFRTALEDLAAAHRHFDLQLVVTGPRTGWTGLHERFTVQRVLRAGRNDSRCLYYLCGPGDLVAEAERGLLGAEVPADRVVSERFVPEVQRDRPGGQHLVTFLHRGILFARRTRRRTRPGETLLEAAERAGLKVRSNCRDGGCGSCKAKLVSGEVSMDEPNALTLADARADRILSCVSCALGPVVVDLR